MALIMEPPINIEDLIKNANCKHSWETRFLALEELRKYDCQQSRDVITRLALHDKVFKVKEEAVRAAQALGITKKGKPISLGKKDIGFKAKDFTKSFLRVKREKEVEVFNLEIFKAGFKELNPEMYDVMSFDKGSKFDSWIESVFTGLPKK
ncbi:HEAT repeat domain-containing protein [Shewanella baltica]|uniref:HEAT repeat domain-containing protein n=1 Tax=Shewanella TaxID=22 RepID=UPI00217CF8A1|nr:HEAT repeat domain-containing protein [Shewanella baltica]MCS6137092.1 HEAT repeat domain-containing protein [Shewanella baltica]GCF91194.1 hypothetical protein SMBr_34380 [Shewanella sp. M-Br]